VQHQFDPATEDIHAQQFSTLADFFNEPQTRDVSERFAMLVALCEEKANILRELNQLPLFRPDSPMSRQVKLARIAPKKLSCAAGEN
jgi:hypothetical protein